jgi:hypothetical protein
MLEVLLRSAKMELVYLDTVKTTLQQKILKFLTARKCLFSARFLSQKKTHETVFPLACQQSVIFLH